MSELQVKPVNEQHLQELKDRMKLISDADPTQYHNEYSLKRYLRAFKAVDDAFKVCNYKFFSIPKSEVKFTKIQKSPLFRRFSRRTSGGRSMG